VPALDLTHVPLLNCDYRRPLLTLATPEARVDWRHIARGALVWAVIAAAQGGDYVSSGCSGIPYTCAPVPSG
jgi:hypothetical protein